MADVSKQEIAGMVRCIAADVDGIKIDVRETLACLDRLELGLEMLAVRAEQLMERDEQVFHRLERFAARSSQTP